MKFAAFLFALLSSVSVLAEEVMHAKDFLPLEVGMRWHYYLDGPDGYEPMEINVLKESKNSAAIEPKEFELATDVDEFEVSTEVLYFTEKGLFRKSLAGKVVEPRWLVLPEPIQLGWKNVQTLKSGEETITVTTTIAEKLERVKVKDAVGEYDAVHTTTNLKTDQAEFTLETWWAKGVGIVKIVQGTGDAAVECYLTGHDTAAHRKKMREELEGTGFEGIFED